VSRTSSPSIYHATLVLFTLDRLYAHIPRADDGGRRRETRLGCTLTGNAKKSLEGEK
jgi:hypothetical protein